MARTIRNLPLRRRGSAMRKPKYRHYLLADDSAVRSKYVVTDYDDKPIAAYREIWHQKP